MCSARIVRGPGLSAAALHAAAAVPSGLSVERNRLENSLVRVELADDGTLTSLYDKRARREALAGRANQIWAYVDKPRNWDAWDLEEDYDRNGEEVAASDRSKSSIRAAPRGDPHRSQIPQQRRSSRR